MQTGFKEHLIAGLLALVALIIVSIYFRVSDISALALGSFAFLVGAVIPDVDHPLSYPRKILITLVLLASLLVMVLLFAPINSVCDVVIGGARCDLISAFIVIAVPLLITSILDHLIPFHRGVLHGFLAALAFGAVLVLVLRASFFVGVFGILGYALHIMLDILGSE